MTIEQTDDAEDDRAVAALATATRHLSIQVLGEVAGTRHGHRLPLGGHKQRAVLAVLIAAHGQVVAGTALVDSLYGERPPPRALRSIHTYVCNLRRELSGLIDTVGRGYRLSLPPDCVDARRFESLLRTSRAVSRSDPSQAASALGEGLALWRGDPYAGLEDVEALRHEIVRLEELRLAAIEAHIDLQLHLGELAEATAELESLVVRHPFREGFCAQLAVALYRAGRQRDALQVFDRNRRNLADVGLEPSRHLQALELRVLCQDPELEQEG